MRTTTQQGLAEEGRVDSKIYFCKDFVATWRSAEASTKLQFLDFLSGNAICPKDFWPMVLGHIDVPVIDPYGWLGDVHLLGTTPRGYRELQQDRDESFRSLSLLAC
jgi:hypothetical protein